LEYSVHSGQHSGTPLSSAPIIQASPYLYCPFQALLITDSQHYTNKMHTVVP